MGHFRVDKFLIDGEFRRHHVVVGGRKYRLRAGGEQGVRGKGDFPVVGARLFHHGDALSFTIGFGGGDGGGGRVLTLVVEQSHRLDIGVCGKHQIKDRIRIQSVRSAGNVGARCIHGCHKPCAHRIGDCGEHHGNQTAVVPRIFCRGILHDHGNRRGNRDDEVHIGGDQICGDLVHGGGVRLPVVGVILVIKENIKFLALFVKLRLNGGDDLV